MVPRYIDLRESLPKTETHRIQKAQLKQQGITPTTWDRDRTPWWTQPIEELSKTRMELKEAIGIRRTIRFYNPYRPVEREKIQKMLEAARLTWFGATCRRCARS